MFSWCRILLPTLALCLAGGSGMAQSSPASEHALDDDPAFLTVSQALADRLFEVAAVKAGRLARQPGQTLADRGRVIELWVEALVRGGKAPEALTVLKSEDVPNEAFWLGQALLLTGEYARPRQRLPRIVAGWKSWPRWARPMLCWARGGWRRPGPTCVCCATVATPGLPATPGCFSMRWRSASRPRWCWTGWPAKGGRSALVQAIRASALIDEGQAAQAEAVLRDLLQVPAADMDRPVRDASTVLLAEALWRQKSPEARSVLLEFINGFQTASSTTDYWPDAFNLLDRMSLVEGPDEALLVAAVGWSVDASLPERQGHALWFLAQELHRVQRDLEATRFARGPAAAVSTPSQGQRRLALGHATARARPRPMRGCWSWRAAGSVISAAAASRWSISSPA